MVENGGTVYPKKTTSRGDEFKPHSCLQEWWRLLLLLGKKTAFLTFFFIFLVEDMDAAPLLLHLTVFLSVVFNVRFCLMTEVLQESFLPPAQVLTHHQRLES